MAVLTIVSTSLSYLIYYLYPVINWQNFEFDNTGMAVGFLALALLSTIFYFYSQSTTYSAILNINLSEKEIFKLGYRKMWRFLLISLIVGLIIGFGALLLIIPALIFGIWYSFSIFLVLDKELRVKEALKQSKAMVKGKFWVILGRNLVFGLFGFLISFIFGLIPYAGGILVSFLAPLFVLPSYLLYRDLSSGLDNLRAV